MLFAYDPFQNNYQDFSQYSRCGSAETNPTSIREDVGSIPDIAEWVKGCGIAALP